MGVFCFQISGLRRLYAGPAMLGLGGYGQVAVAGADDANIDVSERPQELFYEGADDVGL